MRLAFSSNAFSLYDLPETIAILAGIGYDGIEIMADVPHAYPPLLTLRKIDAILEALSRHRIEVANVNAFTMHAEGDTWNPSWIDPDPWRRERRIRHTIDAINFAATIGSPTISTEPGGPVKDIYRERWLDIFHEGLMQVEGVARAKGVRVLIEPEPELLIETSGEYLDFFRRLDPAVFGLNFDIGHFFCVGEDPASVVPRVRDSIGHVHLEDIATTRRHVHLIPGEGAIDLEGVLGALDVEGYSGFVTVELYTCQDRPIAAAEASYRHLAKMFRLHRHLPGAAGFAGAGGADDEPRAVNAEVT